ncbi:DUF3368 domain-containing protein [uncultured Thiodictyon sp.]|jgi:predicted nucleic acid-binding protein|uniref:DUF3368 domain-containing protein n=1 Tax=uncultured Thiodictyon sp. TaxID=1846217 RepID=UPI0025D77C87|nr:DUF3368 domain-containing protein [uncultured Thiodictyon sp.]
MDPIVIADAGPLIALASTGELGLLRRLFGEVRVAQAVERECSAKQGDDQAAITAAVAAGWLRVVAAAGCDESVPMNLGTGEHESIRLALAQPDRSLVILDDRLARRYALRLGLNVVGTVRLLDLAERRGFLGSAELLIEQMRQNGYRISPVLLRNLRADGG